LQAKTVEFRRFRNLYFVNHGVEGLQHVKVENTQEIREPYEAELGSAAVAGPFDMKRRCPCRLILSLSRIGMLALVVAGVRRWAADGGPRGKGGERRLWRRRP